MQQFESRSSYPCEVLYSIDSVLITGVLLRHLQVHTKSHDPLLLDRSNDFLHNANNNNAIAETLLLSANIVRARCVAD